MDVVSFNPYELRITDPLFDLANRRSKIESSIESGSVKPIYVMILGEEKLIFNGNKRTVVSRELFRNIFGKIIASEEDLFEAQMDDPRAFPREIEFSYTPVLIHLHERAEMYAGLNYQVCPVELSIAKKRMSPLIGRKNL